MTEHPYHWRDGVYFRREEDGSVTIELRPPNWPHTSKIGPIPPDEWESILATLSGRANADGVAAAREFHRRS